MKKHPASSKQFEDLKKELKEQELQGFKDGVPVDDRGHPITNLQASELSKGGGKVMAEGTGIDDHARLVRTHGGKAADWEKVKSTPSAGLDIHAYRNKQTGQVVEHKTKHLDEPKTPDSPKSRRRSTPPKEQPATYKPETPMSKLHTFKENSSLTEKKKQAHETAAAREQARTDRAQASKDKVAEIRMKKQGGELTGSDTRKTERHEKVFKEFKENFQKEAEPKKLDKPGSNGPKFG